MKIFYIRCSTVEQNEERQLVMSKEYGAEKIFVDKASGKNTDRPEFKKMMQFVREGDTVYCESISRIARNTKDLLNIIEELHNKRVDFVSLKENIDTSTPQGKFILTVFGALAELERDSILQRQAEGIAIAKAKGTYKGRQPKKVDYTKFIAMCKEWRKGERTAVSIQKAFDITATTFYRWVREREL